MERKPLSTGSIVGAVVLLVVVLLGLYVGGYFALGEYEETNSGTDIRYYRYDWQARLYQPLAYLESVVTGKELWLNSSITVYSSTGEAWPNVTSDRWKEQN